MEGAEKLIRRKKKQKKGKLSERNFAIIAVKQKNKRVMYYILASFKFSLYTADCIRKLNNI